MVLGVLEEEGYQTEPQTAGQTTSWLLGRCRGPSGPLECEGCPVVPRLPEIALWTSSIHVLL